MSNQTNEPSPLALARREKKRLRVEREARILEAQAETQAIVDLGVCPRCSCSLVRNYALSGWWQCSQFGAAGFRKDANKPGCSWQGFTR